MCDSLTGVSLFTGAGGMDIGFEHAGVEVVFANELMPEAAATYNANHNPGVMVNDNIYNMLDRYWLHFLATKIYIFYQLTK